MSHICLNCETEITLNYCPKCGQKSSIHRYSLDHFLKHDVVHGVWHVDNSLPNTVLQLFSRPGHSIREFLKGKRSKLFNFISLIILLLAVSSMLLPYAKVHMADLMSENSKKTMEVLQEFTNKYPKIFMMITIPIYSLFSFMWFRKAKLNFSEHMVLNSYRVCGELLIGICFSILTIYYTNIEGLKKVYFWGVFPFLFFYQAWIYYQFFSVHGYSKWTRIWRSIMPYISVNLALGVLGVIGGILFGYFKSRN